MIIIVVLIPVFVYARRIVRHIRTPREIMWEGEVIWDEIARMAEIDISSIETKKSSATEMLIDRSRSYR